MTLRSSPKVIAVVVLVVLTAIWILVFAFPGILTGPGGAGQVEQDRCIGQYGVISPCP